jgi:glycosyltransferase involved in cell wall biosynthesis
VRVGIDISILETRERTGVERFQLGLLRALARLDLETSYLLFSPEPIELPFELPPNFEPIHRGGGKRVLLWRETHLPALLRDHEVEVFHSPVSAIPIRGRARKIATIHEVPWRRHKNVEGRGGRLIRAVRLFVGIKVAAAIVVPSKRTAEDVLHLYPDAKERVCVIHPGVGDEFHRPRGRLEIRETLRTLSLPEAPFFLFVGTLRRKKNVSLLLEAFARVAESMPETVLVFAGKAGDEEAALRERTAALCLADRVRFTGYVEEEDLPWLYAAATALVYPSVTEGFGFPPLESFACGTPVVASDGGSIPEIAADAAYLVKEGDAGALAEGLHRIATDGPLRRFLVDRGLARAREFTWEACAERMIGLYRRLAGG